MGKEEKSAVPGCLGEAFGRGFAKVTGDIGTAYQQVLLQDSPLSVQSALDNALSEDIEPDQALESETPELEPNEPDAEPDLD